VTTKIDWETVAGILAGVTDKEAHIRRLQELKAATIDADRRVAEAEKLKTRYESAASLHAEAAALLLKANVERAALVEREQAVAATERKLSDREAAVEEREQAVVVHQRLLQQRADHLDEIARTAAA
jgi:hypothetical protein